MGQCCCKPCGGPQWIRLSKVKAEAAATADAARLSNLPQPDPAVAQLLVNNDNNNGNAPTAMSGSAMSQGAIPASSAVQLGPPPLSSPLPPPRPNGAEIRIAIEDNEPQPQQPRSSRRKDSREWLYRQRKRLTKPRTIGRQKKNKVKLARDEAPVSGMQPIIMIEASSSSPDEEDNYDDRNELLLVGEDRVSTSPEELDTPIAHLDSSLTRPLRLRSQEQKKQHPQQQQQLRGPQLVAPTPRRPISTRFPFLNPATISASTTRSSNDSHHSSQSNQSNQRHGSGGVDNKETHRDDGGDSIESHSSMTPSTIIALRRPVLEDSGRNADRSSLQSRSPSIYYLAPTSPQIHAAEDTADTVQDTTAAPAVIVTRASSPLCASQPQVGTEEDFLDAVMSFMASQ